MDRLALPAYPELELVALLLDAEARGMDRLLAAFARAGYGLARGAMRPACHVASLLGAPGDVRHAIAMLGRDDFAGIVVQAVTDDQRHLAVVEIVHVRPRHAGRQRNIAGHLVPEEMKFVALVPDVIAGGGDGVGLGRRVITGGAWYQRPADIGAVFELADRLVEGYRIAVKILGRRDLLVGGRPRQCPVRHFDAGRRGRRDQRLRQSG